VKEAVMGFLDKLFGRKKDEPDAAEAAISTPPASETPVDSALPADVPEQAHDDHDHEHGEHDHSH
jgi:hypothetical protein